MSLLVKSSFPLMSLVVPKFEIATCWFISLILNCLAGQWIYLSGECLGDIPFELGPHS